MSDWEQHYRLGWRTAATASGTPVPPECADCARGYADGWAAYKAAIDAERERLGLKQERIPGAQALIEKIEGMLFETEPEPVER